MITVSESTAGSPASMELGKLLDDARISIIVNDKKVEFPKFASVNGAIQTGFYELQDGDEVELLSYYTIKQITEFMDVILDKNTDIYVNHQIADENARVYDNFSVVWTLGEQKVQASSDNKESAGENAAESAAESSVHEETQREAAEGFPETVKREAAGASQETTQGDLRENAVEGIEPAQEQSSTSVNAQENTQTDATGAESDTGNAEAANAEDGTDAEQSEEEIPRTVNNIVYVSVNQKKVILSGKPDYIFVDVFDHIDFDLSKPKGSTVVLKLNGVNAAYTDLLKTGDVLDIYWAD
ncbi:MAG: hypothetical protein J6P60_05255 [Lachnospiraceae bacterium]|nr:hypothetical protein [Lachnospiraceae bacterium]